MKNIKSIKLSFAFLFLLLCSCSINLSNNDNEKHSSKEYNSIYVCPMHCEGSGSDSSGTCPKCKMDYVKNEYSQETK